LVIRSGNDLCSYDPSWMQQQLIFSNSLLVDLCKHPVFWSSSHSS